METNESTLQKIIPQTTAESMGHGLLVNHYDLNGKALPHESVLSANFGLTVPFSYGPWNEHNYFRNPTDPRIMQPQVGSDSVVDNGQYMVMPLASQLVSDNPNNNMPIFASDAPQKNSMLRPFVVQVLGDRSSVRWHAGGVKRDESVRDDVVGVLDFGNRDASSQKVSMARLHESVLALLAEGMQEALVGPMGDSSSSAIRISMNTPDNNLSTSLGLRAASVYRGYAHAAAQRLQYCALLFQNQLDDDDDVVRIKVTLPLPASLSSQESRDFSVELAVDLPRLVRMAVSGFTQVLCTQLKPSTTNEGKQLFKERACMELNRKYLQFVLRHCNNEQSQFDSAATVSNSNSSNNSISNNKDCSNDSKNNNINKPPSTLTLLTFSPTSAHASIDFTSGALHLVDSALTVMLPQGQPKPSDVKYAIQPLPMVVNKDELSFSAQNEDVVSDFLAQAHTFKYYGSVEQRDEAFDAFKLFCSSFFFTLVFESRGEALLSLKCSHAGQYKTSVPEHTRKRHRTVQTSKKDGCGFACSLVYYVNGLSCAKHRGLDPSSGDKSRSYWAVHQVACAQHATHAQDERNLSSDFQYRKLFLSQLQDEIMLIADQEKTVTQLRKECTNDALNKVNDEDLRNAANAFLKRGRSFEVTKELRVTKRYVRTARKKESLDIPSLDDVVTGAFDNIDLKPSTEVLSSTNNSAATAANPSSAVNAIAALPLNTQLVSQGNVMQTPFYPLNYTLFSSSAGMPTQPSIPANNSKDDASKETNKKK